GKCAAASMGSRWCRGRRSRGILRLLRPGRDPAPVRPVLPGDGRGGLGTGRAFTALLPPRDRRAARRAAASWLLLAVRQLLAPSRSTPVRRDQPMSSLFHKPLTEKYRPATWADVVGQQKTVERIRQLAERGGLTGRAFFLTGQSGTGKTTIARLIAQEVAGE